MRARDIQGTEADVSLTRALEGYSEAKPPGQAGFRFPSPGDGRMETALANDSRVCAGVSGEWPRVRAEQLDPEGCLVAEAVGIQIEPRRGVCAGGDRFRGELAPD